MDQLTQLRDLLGDSLPALLQSINDALIVLDKQRDIRFVNARARQMLGYSELEQINGRCRLTTRGTDCGTACPLTFALEQSLDSVKDFPTIYRTRDDRPVPLKVTVIPLRNSLGELTGSVEILRPQEADPGFFLAGCSSVTERLRTEVTRWAATGTHLMLVGEMVAVLDVAHAILRLSGLASDHFHHWPGSWEQIPSWPPGILFVTEEELPAALTAEQPAGWRRIIGARSCCPVPGIDSSLVETIELPALSELQADLPLMLSAWVRQLHPLTRVTQPALQWLVQEAERLGLEELQKILASAVAAAAGAEIELCHLPVAIDRPGLLDDLLRQPDPLSALEKQVLREALGRTGWHMQMTAERLGISRVTLWRKMRDHGIERPAD